MKINGKEVFGIIFDLDGTLLDSCSIWSEIDKAFFKKRNLVQPDDYSAAIGHIGLDKAATYTINRFNLKETKEDILKEWKQGVLDYYSHIKLKPGVKEFIEYLKENKIPFCAATANDEDCYKKALEVHNIYDDFQFILEVRNYKKGKDNPDIYLDAAKKMNLKAENVAVFEDLYTALKTVKQAGFITVGVFEQSHNDQNKIQKLVDQYIVDFRELIKCQ